ncbi:MAG: hypothetical protein C0502_00015 [Opitutus sp.]|nr:hypothetical protein [Opitutus sp.]
MITLAGLRYARVMAVDGGPIARLVCGEASELGVRVFSAQATLRDDLVPSRKRRQLWSSADGGGTASSPLLARIKAVSEALERWAHAALHVSPDAARYGFDVDPSSNGMAAFPGLFARQARRVALLEAAERFNLLHWWEGRLRAVPREAPWPGVDAYAIESGAPGVTVILHRRSDRGNHAYGHAAGTDFLCACLKAAEELERHDTVVRLWSLAYAGGMREPALAEMLSAEQRSLFFSTDEGHSLFRERVAAGPAGPAARPKLVFDGVVPGPWSRYADVWRVVFEPPSRRFLSRDPHYFLW